MNKKRLMRGMLVMTGVSIILRSGISLGAGLDMNKSDNLFVRSSINALLGVSVNAEDWQYSVNSDETTLTITGYTGTATKLVVPDTIDEKKVTKITEFLNADSNITSISIPAGVNSIGDYSAQDNVETQVGIFQNASTLEEINVNEDNAFFSSTDGILYNKDKTKLLRYPPAKGDTICKVDGNVTQIYQYAFFGNNKLTKVWFKTKPEISVDGSGQNGLDSSIDDTVPPFVDLPVDWSKYSITTIGNNAFEQCTQLKDIFIPGSVTTIGASAFLRMF